MSSTDAGLRYPAHDLRRRRKTVKASAAPMPVAQAPIVPPHSIAGRSLVGVIAIMSFLASLTLGAVVLVRTSASEWQAQVAREATIQVRPTPGRDLEAEVARAALIARGTAGISQVKPYSKEESLRLLEPWLGGGLSLDELPVPRLIVVTIAPGGRPDFDQLRRAIAEQVIGASVDDHRAFVERMRAMTRVAMAAGLAMLALMLLATVLLVAFATRGAMATNRTIVEVLHFVGAKNRYIAGQFQRHFLLLGLKGAAVGGGGAVGLFLLAQLAGARWQAMAGAQELESLFGSPVLTPDGYAGIVGVVVLIAAVAAITSRWTVHRTLNNLE